jgi:competence protein ComEA
MKQASHDTFALRVIALVMAAGVGVWYGSQRSSPQWLLEEHPGVGEGVEQVGRLSEQATQENARARRRATRLAPGEQIDPNTADVDELQRLPRVGPSLAARIVQHREANGPFRTLADLDAVPGIGPALLAGIVPHVGLPPAPATTPAPAAPASPVDQGRGRAGAAPPVTEAAPLDLNTATAEDLQRLPGVGPVLAARILEWRQANGRFRSVADLEKVSGIGPRTAQRLAPLVRVGP